MTLTHVKRAWPAGVVGLVTVLVLTAVGASAQTSNNIGAEAYGAFVQTPAASLPKTPLAFLDPASGMADAENPRVNVADVLVAESLSSISTGVVGENAASSQSNSTLQNVNILNGLITAKAVAGVSSSVSNGTKASGHADGSTFVELVVNGVPLGDGPPPPNTRQDLPGVGTVILNEQTQRGDGLTSAGLSVKMIHVLLKDPLTGAPTGEIIVAAADSDVSFVR